MNNSAIDTNAQMKKIGEHIRKLRKEHTKYGYIEFATHVGLDKKTYYKLERGDKDYYIANLLKVISFYPNYSLEQFFKEVGL